MGHPEFCEWDRPRSESCGRARIELGTLAGEGVCLVRLGHGWIGRLAGFRFRLRGRTAEYTIRTPRQQVVLLERQANAELHFAHRVELLARQSSYLDGINNLGSLD